MKKPSKEDLVELHVNNKMSTYKIADIFGVDRTTVCNWLKSFEIESNYRKKQKSLDSIVLTDLQKDFLIGSILGDGHIGKNRRLAKYCTSHSEKQKEYIDWIGKIFGDLGRISNKYTTTNKKTNKQYSFYNLYTTSAPEFVVFREKFYKDKIKIIPGDLDKIFKSTLSLAVWPFG